MKKIMTLAIIALASVAMISCCGQPKKKADACCGDCCKPKTECCEKKTECCEKKTECCEKKTECCEKKAECCEKKAECCEKKAECQKPCCSQAKAAPAQPTK